MKGGVPVAGGSLLRGQRGQVLMVVVTEGTIIQSSSMDAAGALDA
jgi:hypothetical protein